MPYVWLFGQIHFGLNDNFAGGVLWCLGWVFGFVVVRAVAPWLLETRKIVVWYVRWSVGGPEAAKPLRLRHAWLLETLAPR